jgi:N-acetylneuraminic acid mutarotase
MPNGRALLGAAAANGKIYAIGGTRDQSSGLTTVEEYDPATNSWTNCAAVSSTGCAPMPSARFALGVATATNGKVYAVGGMVSNAVEEYEVTPFSWLLHTFGELAWHPLRERVW